MLEVMVRMTFGERRKLVYLIRTGGDPREQQGFFNRLGAAIGLAMEFASTSDYWAKQNYLMMRAELKRPEGRVVVEPVSLPIVRALAEAGRRSVASYS